jgi:hypothetical protein
MDIACPAKTQTTHVSVPVALVADSRLTPAALRYYAVTMLEPDLEVQEIALRIRATPKTVRRARSALLSAGWIEIVTTRGLAGLRTEHRCLPAPLGSARSEVTMT